MPFMGYGGDGFRKIVNKTASYRMVPEDVGTLFTNRGAGGAVTFTLPITTDIVSGWWCEVFACVLAQNLVLATYNSLDDLTTFNDLTADSITFSTSSEIAGASVRAVWDGTGWLCFLMTQETQTATIA